MPAKKRSAKKAPKPKKVPTITSEQKRSLRARVEWEGGMDYTFRYYSSFPEIKDPVFQKLVKAYRKAANALSEHCGLDEEDPEEGDDWDEDGE